MHHSFRKRLTAIILAFLLITGVLPAVTPPVMAADHSVTLANEATVGAYCHITATEIFGVERAASEWAEIGFTRPVLTGSPGTYGDLSYQEGPPHIGADGTNYGEINGILVFDEQDYYFIADTEGTYTFTAYYDDELASISDNYNVTITVDPLAAVPTVTEISPTSGPTAGGTSVTITGTNFTGATAVSFGATNAASFTVDSATQITAVSPARAAGTVDITVTTAGGTSATGADDQFTYTASNTLPAFIGGTTALTVNANASATDIKVLLHASDTDIDQTLTWTQHTAPNHGTLTVSGATAASGSADITPGGTITYTPAAGFSGSDSFTVQVSDGTASATRTIAVTVNSTSGIVTEHYDDESNGATACSCGGFGFTLTGGKLSVANIPTYGWTGTVTDDWYADNYSHLLASEGTVGSIQIEPGATFRVHDLYIFPGVTGDFVSNDGTVVISGKLEGSTEFTDTVESGEINVFSPPNNGWTYVDLSAYSSQAIDTLEFELGGNLRYLAVDAVRHESTSLPALPPAPTVTAVNPANGPTAGGTSVTIMGTSFTGATAVTIGGTAATDVTVVNATTITATTPAGTAGAKDVAVTTPDGTGTGAGLFTYVAAPTVTTQAVTDITATTATGNGNITALGSPNPTQHGVVWSTSENPTIADSKTTEGAAAATGAFTGSITGLTPGMTYHVRAYATNDAGTAYGADVTFTTAEAATGGWVEPNQNIEGLNYNTSESANSPSVVRFGGEWYAAWQEAVSGGSSQIRVAKQSAADGTWSFIDGGGAAGINFNSTKSASSPKLVVYSGNLFAVWTESSSIVANGSPRTVDQVRVRKYNGGSSWTFVDAVDANGATALQPGDYATYDYPYSQYVSATADATGLYVAWAERCNSGSFIGVPTTSQLHVAKYNGTDWSIISDTTAASGLNISPEESVGSTSIATAGSGNLYLTWTEKGNVYVKSYNGTVWSGELSGSANGLEYDASKNINNPTQVAILDGVPYVAWLEANAGGINQVRVKKYVTGSWTSVDGGGLNYNPAKHGSSTALAADADNLYLGWSEASAAVSQFRIMSYNPADGWSAFDADGISAGDDATGINMDTLYPTASKSIGTGDGKLCALFCEGESYVYRIQFKEYDPTFSLPANGARLSGLTASAGTLVPAFSNTVYDYVLLLDKDAASVDITPTPADGNAIMLYNGLPVASGSPLNIGGLPAGDTNILIKLVADEAAIVKHINIRINRAVSDTQRMVSAAGDSFFDSDGYYCPEGDTYTYPGEAVNWVGYDDSYGVENTSVLKFDYSFLAEDVTAGELSVKVRSVSDDRDGENPYITLTGSADTDWTEQSASLPVSGGSDVEIITADDTGISEGAWKNIDVTAYLTGLSGKTPVFVLEGNAVEEDVPISKACCFTFYSRENSVDQPKLLLTLVAAAPTVTGINPTGGPTAGGTSVTITGTNFTGATAVTIGGTAATDVTVVNATTITATTPAGTAGAKDVAVTTPDGTGTGVGLFTYIAPPTVTAANISISGASGTAGAYKIGDTVTATWNNTAGGDNNSGITAVTVDFTAFGGGAAVAATNSAETWTATYTIGSGAIDGTNRNITVTATKGEYGSATTADTTNATVDNVAPTVTAANISISGGSGTAGAYIVGDTVTATWDNTAGGDNNSDTIASVTVDFTAFGGGAAVAATNAADTWTATYTIVPGAIDGTNRNINVTATDNAGNTMPRADTTNATVDNAAPTVSSVSVPANGTYIAGQNLDFTVNWNENVTVSTGGGTPSIALNVGGTTRYAAYLNGTGSSALVFRYTVQAGDSDTNGITVGALSANGGAIRDAKGNNANLTLNSVGATAAVLVDAVAPTVSSVSVPANATYVAGQNLSFTVNWSENVTVNTAGGTPRIALDVGGTTRYAEYASGSGTSALVFRYTVQAGDDDSDGITIGALSANGGTIRDAAGNSANPTLNSVGSAAGVLVDTSPPAAPSVPDMTAASDTGASDSDDITSDTTPTFTGTAEANSTVTLYSDASSVGTTTADAGGNWSITAAPALAEGTHTVTAKAADTAGNVSAASGGLSITIDITAPAAPAVASAAALTNDSTPAWTWTADGGGNGTFRFKLDDNNLTIGATTTTTGAWTPASALGDGSHTLYVQETDAAGNWSAGGSFAVTIDTAAPTVTLASPTSDPTNTSPIPVVITFSKDVTGFAAGDITVAGGTKGALAGSGQDYTIDITPTGDGLITVDVAAGAATDAAGNGSLAAVQLARTYDTSVLSVTLTSGASEYTNNSPIPVVITFSKDVTGFTIGDITVTGGTKGALAGSGKDYTIDITPAGDGIVTVDVAAGTATDAAGNDNLAAPQLTRIYDSIAPAVADGTITVGTVSQTTVSLAWTAGTDAGTLPAELAYKVVYSSTDNLATVTETENNGTTGMNWTPGSTSANVAGLAANTTYYFNVLVKDRAGNKSVYTTAAQKTNPKPKTDDKPNDNPAPSDPGATVIVNDEPLTAGTAQTANNADGQSVTTVTVDSAKLESILAAGDRGATVTIPITNDTDVAAGVLTGGMVKTMEDKEATLVIQTEASTYTLPASEINIDAVSVQLGTDVSLSDITVTVSISEPPDEMVTVAQNAAGDGGFTLVVPGVAYTLTCEYGGRTVEVCSFTAYVQRTIAIPAGVDPEKITTAVVVEPDGTVRHVPTQITVIDGRYYAVINSLTNSVYSVVWHPVEFSDVAGHWARDVINDLGSRLVMDAVANNNFAPENKVTRAEFAAVIVRALGLEPGTGPGSFTDVQPTDWYCGYVDTAARYGIVCGYDAVTFGPDDLITREQAMIMLVRATKTTGLRVSLNENDIAGLLGAFPDGLYVPAYARNEIAACLKTGIVSGTGSGSLALRSYVTRAEVAAMVQRLLQKSGLI